MSLNGPRLIHSTHNKNKVGINLLPKNIQKESKLILLKVQYDITTRKITKRKKPEK